MCDLTCFFSYRCWSRVATVTGPWRHQESLKSEVGSWRSFLKYNSDNTLLSRSHVICSLTRSLLQSYVVYSSVNLFTIRRGLFLATNSAATLATVYEAAPSPVAETWLRYMEFEGKCRLSSSALPTTCSWRFRWIRYVTDGQTLDTW